VRVHHEVGQGSDPNACKCSGQQQCAVVGRITSRSGTSPQPTGKPEPLIFDHGTERHEVDDCAVAVDEGDGLIGVMLAGPGVGQHLRRFVQPYLDSGELAAVLDDWTRPAIRIHVVYPPDRHQSAPAHCSRTSIDLHLEGADCNPWYLAEALRHSFAHGALTATPTGVESQAIGSVSRFLSRAMFQVMDIEFRDRVRQFERAVFG